MKKFLIFIVLLAIVVGIIWKIQPRWLQQFMSTWIKASGIHEETDPSGRMIAAYYYTGTSAADVQTCVNLRHASDGFLPQSGVVYKSNGSKPITIHWVSDQLLRIEVVTASDDYYNSPYDGITMDYVSVKP